MWMSAQFDIVIRGGTVVDGTGTPGFQADVAIKDGVIAAVGAVAGKGREEIDAAGLVVTPGFVDVHTHYDGQVTWENTLAPSSNHGVTTVVMGNCGVGFAPSRPEHRQLMVKLMEGVEDIPEVVMTDGVPWKWETFPEYLDFLDTRRTDVDFAAQLPHSPLRVYVMGERGTDLEPPTETDLAEMRRITREAIEAGALGVTTSRQLAHSFRDGRPAPSTKTEIDELKALAEGLKDAGAGVFQIIPNTNLPTPHEWEVIETLNEASGGKPVNFSLFTGSQVVGGPEPLLDGLARARQEGRRIHGQFFPRPIGMLFGIELSYHPFSLNPSYKQIEHLPLEEKVARMRDPVFRKQLLSEQPEDPNPFFLWVVQQTHILFPLGDPPNYNPHPSDSIKARAETLGIDERELMYDELLRQNGKAIIYCPMGNTENNRFDAAVDLFGKPGTVLGLGDGGAHYGMICDAAYPTYMLSEYVRDSHKMPIEQAVSMLSRETAETVNLFDRGVIKPGYKADINLIDLDRLHLYAPRVKHDLPAGGKRLSQQSDGYEATIVSGEITYRRGRPTGKLPGRLVRHGRPAPADALAAAE
jgi:N-acyl-D-aspartate/D-glutamate deacylase